MAFWGGIEGGGTKFKCAIADDEGHIVVETSFPTTTPQETIERTIQFFQEHQAQKPLAGLGIAAFGPVDLNLESPTYGYITTTPKPGWGHVDLLGPIQKALDVPAAFDTDVNGAALGEYRWGAAQGLDTFYYLTIGTGIGGGGMLNGRLIHGILHPEMGHMRIPHDLERDPFPGSCPYHGDCLEGLAAGPALEARWQQRGETLPPEHPAWALEAHYIAHALANLTLISAPQRIILGGGVMHREQLLPMIRQEVISILNGYFQKAEILEHIDDYIVPPGLGDQAGVMGAIALAQSTQE